MKLRIAVLLLSVFAFSETTPTVNPAQSAKFAGLVIRQQQVYLNPQFQAFQNELGKVSEEWKNLEASTLKEMKLDPTKYMIAIDQTGTAIVKEKAEKK